MGSNEGEDAKGKKIDNGRVCNLDNGDNFDCGSQKRCSIRSCNRAFRFFLS